MAAEPEQHPRTADDSWRTFRHLADSAIDVVLEADAHTVIRWASPSVTDVLGWEPDELTGMRASDLVHPEDQQMIADLVILLNTTGSHVHSTRCRIRSSAGRYRSMRLRARAITDSDGTVSGHIVNLQDTSERDAALRALATLTEAGRVLTRAPSVAALRTQMCEAVVNAGGYAFAWYGVPVQDAERSVLPVAHAGDHATYLASVAVSWGDGATGQGPTGAALRTASTQVRDDFADDAAYQPWLESAGVHGFRSSISLPVLVDGEVDGALMVYSAETHSFDRSARELLEDLAADMGVGIERLRAIEQVTADRERLAATLDTQFDPFVLLEAMRDEAGQIIDFRYVEVSQAACHYNGLSREQMIGARLTDLFPGQRDSGALAAYAATVESGEPIAVDDYLYFHEPLGREVRLDMRAVRSGDGIAITFRDVTERYEAGRRIAESERLYRLLAENSTDVVLHADRSGELLWVSPSSATMLGWDPEELMGRDTTDFIHPDDRAELLAAVRRSAVDGSAILIRYRWRCKDGTYLWVESAGRPIPDDFGGHAGQRVVRLRDIDAQLRAEMELAAREERYRMLAENVSDMVWQVDPDGTITWASESVTPVLGWENDDVVGRVAMDLIDPADRARALDSRDLSLTGRTTYGEYRVLCADGRSRWMGFTIRPYITEQGVGRVDALRDIHEEVLTRAELAFAVEHDVVTGLPTRQATLAHISSTLGDLDDGGSAGLLCVGVDSLATVNDALTYAAGDVVLAELADRLRTIVDASAVVGKGTGDEFLVLLPDLADPSDAAILASRIRLAIKDPITTLGQQVLATVSIGIAVGDRRTDPLRLLGDASLALRQAKDRGRDRFEFVDAGLALQSQTRLALESDMRRGLAEGEFVAWFQPIASMGDGRIAGYEALVRWMREGQAVPPSEFLPTAERSTLVHDIDVAVLRQALAQLASLPGRPFMSVNASSWSLARGGYAHDVEAALADTGVDPGRLHLEVTETALLSVSDEVRATMTRLAALGVRWYVDDFGTGYSSISHLRDLPVSGLKLDLSFTRAIGAGDVTSVRLAQGLVGLAEGLELDTVAEGVETEFEASILHSQGWRRGQGWLYGRPEPIPAPGP